MNNDHFLEERSNIVVDQHHGGDNAGNGDEHEQVVQVKAKIWYFKPTDFWKVMTGLYYAENS